MISLAAAEQERPEVVALVGRVRVIGWQKGDQTLVMTIVLT
jgi:hypothetical protein